MQFHSVSLMFALVVAFSCLSSAAQNGLELFHKMQIALGGADKIASVRDFEQTERAKTWDNNGNPQGVVRKRVRFIRPNFLRIDQVGPGDTYVLYFDGSSGWEILPNGNYTALAGGELKFAENYLKELNLNSWLSDRNQDAVFTSPAPNAFAVHRKGDSSPGNTITLDPVTFLPIKEASTSHADPTHPVSAEMLFGDWSDIDGIKFPRRLTNFHSGRKLAEIFVEKIQLNSGLKQSDLARKPLNLKPVMSQ